MAGVLTALVGVMDQLWRRSAAKPCHVQRIGHDVRRHPQLYRPADQFAVGQVQHHCQVKPAFLGPDIDRIGRPDLIGCLRREIPGQQNRRHWQIVPGIGRRHEMLFMPRPDAVLAHQPLHPRFACRQTAPTNLFDHSRRSIRAFEFLMNRLYQRQHLGIGQARSIADCKWLIAKLKIGDKTLSHIAAGTIQQLFCEFKRPGLLTTMIKIQKCCRKAIRVF